MNNDDTLYRCEGPLKKARIADGRQTVSSQGECEQVASWLPVVQRSKSLSGQMSMNPGYSTYLLRS